MSLFGNGEVYLALNIVLKFCCSPNWLKLQITIPALGRLNSVLEQVHAILSLANFQGYSVCIQRDSLVLFSTFLYLLVRRFICPMKPRKWIDTCKQISNLVSFLAGPKARPICFKQGQCEMFHLLSIFEGYLALHQHR